ncbi:hypothetical protein Pmani_028047 [Petrolisthes manimaculis]|uniref:Uncharacterized protein n=1 Tax=Petrolisthes manimaculis TaxID=1843537 RepID=A0AAE1TYD6_9EUCA|nr:hypothetical protein Pmani_028047 [Petrolisthes manimaculis]
MLQEYPALLSTTITQHTHDPGNRHTITTILDPPVRQIPRKIPPEWLEAAKREFNVMLQQGIETIRQCMGVATTHGAKATGRRVEGMRQLQRAERCMPLHPSPDRYCT